MVYLYFLALLISPMFLTVNVAAGLTIMGILILVGLFFMEAAGSAAEERERKIKDEWDKNKWNKDKD